MTDFMLADHGSIFVLTPVTEAAEAWAKKHLSEEEATWDKAGIVIKPRYVRDIVFRISSCGLTL